MKSVPKLIHRFISIFLLSSVLIILLNIIAFVVLVANYAPSEDASPYTIARATGKPYRFLLTGNMPYQIACPQN